MKASRPLGGIERGAREQVNQHRVPGLSCSFRSGEPDFFIFISQACVEGLRCLIPVGEPIHEDLQSMQASFAILGLGDHLDQLFGAITPSHGCSRVVCSDATSSLRVEQAAAFLPPFLLLFPLCLAKKPDPAHPTVSSGENRSRSTR